MFIIDEILSDMHTECWEGLCKIIKLHGTLRGWQFSLSCCLFGHSRL